MLNRVRLAILQPLLVFTMSSSYLSATSFSTPLLSVSEDTLPTFPISRLSVLAVVQRRRISHYCMSSRDISPQSTGQQSASIRRDRKQHPVVLPT